MPMAPPAPVSSPGPPMSQPAVTPAANVRSTAAVLASRVITASPPR
jgi:hypothetical protein